MSKVANRTWSFFVMASFTSMILVFYINAGVAPSGELTFDVDPVLPNSVNVDLSDPRGNNLNSVIYKIKMAEKTEDALLPIGISHIIVPRLQSGAYVNTRVMRINRINQIRIQLEPGTYRRIDVDSLSKSQITITPDSLRWPLVIRGNPANKTAYVFDGENKWAGFIYANFGSQSKNLTIQGLTIKNFAEGITIDGYAAFNSNNWLEEGFKKYWPSSEPSIRIDSNAFLNNGNYRFSDSEVPSSMAILRLSYISDAEISNNYFDSNYNKLVLRGKFPRIISDISSATAVADYNADQWSVLRTNKEMYVRNEREKEHILHLIYLANYSHRNRIFNNTFKNSRSDVIRLRNFSNHNEIKNNVFVSADYSIAGAITSWHDKKNAAAGIYPDSKMECSSIGNYIENNDFNLNLGISVAEHLSASFSPEDCRKENMPIGGTDNPQNFRSPSGTKCCDKYQAYLQRKNNNQLNYLQETVYQPAFINVNNKRNFSKRLAVNVTTNKLVRVTSEPANFQLQIHDYSYTSAVQGEAKLNNLYTTYSGLGCVKVRNEPLNLSTFNSLVFASNYIADSGCVNSFNIPQTQSFNESYVYRMPKTVVSGTINQFEFLNNIKQYDTHTSLVSHTVLPELNLTYKVSASTLYAQMGSVYGCVESVSYCPRRGFDSLTHKVKLADMGSSALNGEQSNAALCLGKLKENLQNCLTDGLKIRRQAVAYYFSRNNGSPSVVKRTCTVLENSAAISCTDNIQLNNFQGILLWNNYGELSEQ